MPTRSTLRRATVGLGLGVVTGAVAAFVVPRRGESAARTRLAAASAVLDGSDEGDE